MTRPDDGLIDLAAGRPMKRIRDEPALLAGALEHRLGGLLFSRVERREVGLEDGLVRHLARLDLAERAGQERLWRTLETANSSLAGRGFTVATIKGLAAQSRWYDRAGERPCVDVDLLLAPGDQRHLTEIVTVLDATHPHLGALEALVDAGYLQWVDIELSPGQWLDLHLDPFKIGLPIRDPDLIWQRMEPFPLPGGGTVLVPDAETSLMMFLLHLCKDRFNQLLAFGDVARILGREDLDWGFIERFLAAEGLEAPVLGALGRVVDVLRIPHPRPQVLAGWRAAAWKALWPRASLTAGVAGTARRTRWQFFLPFLVRGREREALRWWWRRLFPPTPAVERWYGPGGGYLVTLTTGRLRQLRAGRLHRRQQFGANQLGGDLGQEGEGDPGALGDLDE